MNFDNFFYVLGAIAGIVTVLYFLKDVFIWLYRRLFYFFSPYKRYSSIYDFCLRSGGLKDEKSIHDLKIAVVDDEPENYPLDDIERSMFSVQWITSVSLSEVKFLCDFDVIFLDITGVVKEDLQRGGFELIKRIKSECSTCYVVGVSSKRFDPTLTEFWSLSDGQVKTPANYVRFEEQISKAWKQNFSSKSISSEIDKIVDRSRITMEERSSANKLVMRYIDNKIDEKELLRKLNGCSHAIDSHAIVKASTMLKGAISNDC